MNRHMTDRHIFTSSTTTLLTLLLIFFVSALSAQSTRDRSAVPGTKSGTLNDSTQTIPKGKIFVTGNAFITNPQFISNAEIIVIKDSVEQMVKKPADVNAGAGTRKKQPN